jgi:hypothetical protein
MMKVKRLLKTKTFWSGVGLLVYGVLNQDLEAVLTGLGLIFVRDAIGKVEEEVENRHGNR